MPFFMNKSFEKAQKGRLYKSKLYIFILVPNLEKYTKKSLFLNQYLSHYHYKVPERICLHYRSFVKIERFMR